MGIHYMNPALPAPGPVDPARPAILLYAPDGDGGLRLLGAEYWQPAVGQPTPTLAGRGCVVATHPRPATTAGRR